MVNPSPERETRTRREQGLSTGFPRSPRRRERKTAERAEKTEIRDAVRVHHRKRTNRTRRRFEDARPERTLDDPIPPRFHPNFKDLEIQLLGTPKSDTAPKRKTDFTKKVGRTLRARYPSGGAGGMNSFFRVLDPPAAGGRRGRPTYCGTVHAKARIERGFTRMQESEMPKKCRKFAAILFLRPLPV